MRQLLPTPIAEVDPYDAYRPTDPDAAVLRLNMVSAADGAATDSMGRTGQLGGRGDLAVFRALRAHADGIMVGAGTVRAEGYGPHRPSPALSARRLADGRDGPAAVIVVSRSLDLDLAARLFTAARTPTIVLTCAASPADSRAAIAAAGAAVVVAGDESVDFADGLRQLRDRFGMVQLLCEGGPTLNGPLLHSGLVDELCLTLAPTLLGGNGPRIVHGAARRRDLVLLGALEEGGELYLRYAVGSSSAHSEAPADRVSGRRRRPGHG